MVVLVRFTGGWNILYWQLEVKNQNLKPGLWISQSKVGINSYICENG